MTALSYADRELKAATRALVKGSNGLPNAARSCRAGVTSLSRWQSMSPDETGRVYFIPIDVVGCLEELTGEPTITRLLARRSGHELVPLPTTHIPIADWHKKLALIAKECSDVTGGICAALDDGVVCADDVRKHDLINQANEMAALGVRIAEWCRRIVEDEE